MRRPGSKGGFLYVAPRRPRKSLKPSTRRTGRGCVRCMLLRVCSRRRPRVPRPQARTRSPNVLSAGKCRDSSARRETKATTAASALVLTQFRDRLRCDDWPLCPGGLAASWRGAPRRLSRGTTIRRQEPPYPDRPGDQLHQAGIELCARVFLKLLDRPCESKSSPIGAVGRHVVDRIGDHDDTRANRDLSSLQPIRIPRPVEVLMMMTNHGFHRTTESRGSRNKLGASSHVSLHRHHLLRIQLSFFPEQRSELFVDLPYIVQECGSFDTVHLARGQPQLTRNGQRVFGNTTRVARCIRVSCLTCLDHQL